MESEKLRCVHGVNYFRHCEECQKYNEAHRSGELSDELPLVFDEDPWKSNQ